MINYHYSMAFDVSNFIASSGKGLNKDVASIKAAAQAIVDKGKTWFDRNYGNSRLWQVAKGVLAIEATEKQNNAQKEATYKKMNWSSEELAKNLADAEVENAADLAKEYERAYNSLTLVKSPVTFRELNQKRASRVKDMEKQIGNASEWLANRLDFSGKDVTEAQKQSAINAKETKAKQAELESLLADGESMGIDTTKAQAVYKNAKGYLVTGTSEAGKSLALRDRSNKAGYRPASRQSADGTWEVYNADTGETVETGFLSPAQSDARATQLQSGSTPAVGGQPNVFAIEPVLPEEIAAVKAGTATVATPEQLAEISVANDAAVAGGTGGGTGGTGGTGDGRTYTSWGLDVTGLTPEQIESLEALYTTAQTDDDLVDSAFTAGEITFTDDEVAEFLESAISESDPYYNQLYSRASEDFQRELKFQAAEREAQIAQTELSNQLAQEGQAEGFAEFNTARSGIRKLAEQRLLSQQEGIRESQSRTFEKSLTDYGRGVEDVVGTSTVSSLEIPSVAGEAVYTPSTEDITGSLEREQLTAQQTRASQLEEEERARRLEILASEGGVSTL